MPISASGSTSNFAHLAAEDEQLLRLGRLAEEYFTADPNTCLLKLRQWAELLAQLVASRVGLFATPHEPQAELLRRLEDQLILSREVGMLFAEVRRAGNAASHHRKGSHRTALSALKLSWQLGVWFHRTFRDGAFEPGTFREPPARPVRVADLEARLAESESAQAALAARLAALQAEAEAMPRATVRGYVEAAQQATDRIELDERETRELIDEQLRAAGWMVDSQTLRHGRGARPERGLNLAIAEWPTAEGPADYVLFAGLEPLAAIEAKRVHRAAAGALKQAERYARGFAPPESEEKLGDRWGEFRLPFAFAANGRPYVKQLEQAGGVWFRDLRRPTNLMRPLVSWPSPEGLLALARLDEERAQRNLAEQGFEYGFTLRPYQIAAVHAVEAAIAAGRRHILLGMATGTGKTKTCIALVYRLLKAQRFRRVLFVVDRTALGEQAAGAFRDTRMESLRTFAEIYGLRDLDGKSDGEDPQVEIATIQSLVRRVLLAGEDELPPPVDTYDCIVVDECHRGYLLDRELSDTELSFRSLDDYISKYSRALDHFDAVRIGLTATPALHTTEIFGPPVFTYSYREAVIDGHLVDHDPPISLRTRLSEHGIHWAAGEDVQRFDFRKGEVELFRTPDELHFDVEQFNRGVLTEAFNRVVCEALAEEIDPSLPGKTLIFCVNDLHAELVVSLLKAAFAARYGSIEDDAVRKITGAADQPRRLILRYKNERLPSVAVTVDLLTTGIDVPAIHTLVFLRRVNSRILFDQMLGRATRPCPEIGKQAFRVFDAVRLFEALEDVTEMRPVVANPVLSFAQLVDELGRATTPRAQALVRDQLLAKLQRRRRGLRADDAERIATLAGRPLAELLPELAALAPPALGAWFAARPGVLEILDRRSAGGRGVLLSQHPDELLAVEHGYGDTSRPEDYLEAFSRFLTTQGDRLPALRLVLQRPRELTRRDLRELLLALDREGFTEARLGAAWRAMTNQDMAARILGYIRQAALGDPLLPYAERVDRALRKLLASRPWKEPQREWLRKIAAQTKANLVVDRAALDDPDQLFRQEGGGFERLDKIFDGRLEEVLAELNDALWTPAA